MILEKVGDKKSRKEFLKVPKILYRDDPNWVCPLDRETEDAFSPEKNRMFREGNACRWIVKNDNGHLIGRVAAFYNHKYSGRNKQPTGGMGWFACIDDQKAANLLFDTARDWLKNEGFEAMDGPVNFGSNDTNWGLLEDGFTQPGLGMVYNSPYYQALFENYGFQLYFRQLSYHLDVTKEFPERFWKIAEWIAAKPDYEFRHLELNKLDQFVQDMIHIYRSAWEGFKEDFIPMDEAEILESFRKNRKIIDENLIWFVYHKGEPISFYVIFPDFNQIIKHFNGKLHFWNKLRFLYYRKTHKITRVRAFVAGVVPKFQNSGVESGIFKSLEKPFRNQPWLTEIELSWVGDYNPKMQSMYEAMGSKLAKKHITYRYLFDREAEFERFMPKFNEKYKQGKTHEFQEEITFDPHEIKPKYNYLKNRI